MLSDVSALIGHLVIETPEVAQSHLRKRSIGKSVQVAQAQGKVWPVIKKCCLRGAIDAQASIVDKKVFEPSKGMESVVSIQLESEF
ncbi:hypothetical protein ES703_70512 [subsurface metagenome]